MKDKVAIILGIIAVFTAIWGVYRWTGRLALAEDVKAVQKETAQAIQKVIEHVEKSNKSLDYKIETEKRESLEEKVQALEEKYRGKVMSQDTRDYLRDLKNRLRTTEEKIKGLEK